MSEAPQKPAVGRRLFFLGLCLFGYILLMAGWWIVSRNASGPAMPVVTLMIQPFAAQDPEAAAAASKLTSDLPNAFANVAGLKVVTTGMADTATAVLNGSVSKSGGNVNIDARLTGARGTPIWSKTYKTNDSVPASVSRDIASDVLAALRKTIH